MEPRTQVELTVSNRTLLRLLAISTAFLLVAWLLWEIRDVLQMLLVAGFLALALNPRSPGSSCTAGGAAGRSRWCSS